MKKIILSISLICGLTSYSQNPTTSETPHVQKEDTLYCISKKSGFNETWDFSGIVFSNYQNTHDSDLVEQKDHYQLYSNFQYSSIGDNSSGQITTRTFTQDSVTIILSGGYKIIYEGDNTLKIPGQTYNNVDKVKVLESYYLTIYSDTLARYTNTYFIYFKKGSKQRLLVTFNKKRLLKGNLGWEYDGISYCSVSNGNGNGNGTNNPASIQMLLNPNPASNNTTVSYSLTNAANVTIQVTNQSGTVNNTIFSGNRPAGQSQKNIALQQYQSGLYTVKLTADGNVFTLPLIIQ